MKSNLCNTTLGTWSERQLQREKYKVDQERLLFEREKHANEQWWRGDTAVAQRLVWLFAVQGLLGGGYAYLKNQQLAQIAVEKVVLLNKLSYAFLFFWFVVNGVIFLSLAITINAQRKLLANYPGPKPPDSLKIYDGGYSVVFWGGWLFFFALTAVLMTAIFGWL